MLTKLDYSELEIKRSIENLEVQMKLMKEMALESISDNEIYEDKYIKMNARRNDLVGMLNALYLKEIG